MFCGFEVLYVGGWLTHGDFALDAGVDFLAVAAHRLIPARVHNEWSSLRGKGVAPVWAPLRIPCMLVMLRLGL